MPLIQAPLAVSTSVVALAALSFWLAERFSWAGKFSPTLLVIVFGAVLSNAGLVTPASSVYDFISATGRRRGRGQPR